MAESNVEQSVRIVIDEATWEWLRLLPWPLVRLWCDLFGDAVRNGKYAARLPHDVDPDALAALLELGEVTLSRDGTRYRHRGFDGVRAERSEWFRELGKRSARSRKARKGTAQPPRFPNDAERRSTRSTETGATERPRTTLERPNDAEQTETAEPAPLSGAVSVSAPPPPALDGAAAQPSFRERVPPPPDYPARSTSGRGPGA